MPLAPPQCGHMLCACPHKTERKISKYTNMYIYIYIYIYIYTYTCGHPSVFSILLVLPTARHRSSCGDSTRGAARERSQKSCVKPRGTGTAGCSDSLPRPPKKRQTGTERCEIQTKPLWRQDHLRGIGNNRVTWQVRRNNKE